MTLTNLLKFKKNTRMQEPIRRFVEAFPEIGAYKRPADTRTPEQITQTLRAYSAQIPEVKAFMNQLEQAPIEAKRLAADVIEFSQSKTNLLTTIDLTEKINGRSFLEKLLNDIITAGESNKPAINFAETVINNTDRITSKYFLREASGGILRRAELGAHFDETSKIVPKIAEETLAGGYTADFSKQNAFMNMLKAFINPEANIQRIGEFPEILKAVDTLPAKNDYVIQVDDFINSTAPKSRIKDNLSTLNPYVKLMEDNGKEPNIVGYLTNNTNLY